jgi:dihydrofolate synthase/folylpolyglutamate synthase
MTYEQALAYLFGRVNYERVSPDPNDLKLDRMRALCGALGNPQAGLRIIHVAGSKGKGSTAAMLASILQRAGHRTGLFTSPHLCAFEERIQIDSQPIECQQLVNLLAEISKAEGQYMATSGSSAPPTFFEVVTALGFLHFARSALNYVVLEVGLGGRFDSTNICDPLLAVITSISHDHTQQLGTELSSIAMEKAGIIKPGCRVVSGVRSPEARTVIQKTCRTKNANLRELGAHFHYRYGPCRLANADEHDDPLLTSNLKSQIEILSGVRRWPVMDLALLGEHQAANAAVAVACVEELQELGTVIDSQAVTSGLAEVKWPARMEVLGRRPWLILDCAHNVASIQALVDTLETSFPPGRRHLVFAASSDKDLDGMLQILSRHFCHGYVTRYSSSPRAARPEELAKIASCVGQMPTTAFSHSIDALRSARAAARPTDLICIAGSVYLAGELRPLLISSVS